MLEAEVPCTHNEALRRPGMVNPQGPTEPSHQPPVLCFKYADKEISLYQGVVHFPVRYLQRPPLQTLDMERGKSRRNSGIEERCKPGV